MVEVLKQIVGIPLKIISCDVLFAKRRELKIRWRFSMIPMEESSD